MTDLNSSSASKVLNSVPPLFTKYSETGEVSHIQLCNAVTKVVGRSKLDGVQRIGGLWRIYLTDVASRLELFTTKPLLVEGKYVELYDQNPYVISSSSSSSSSYRPAPQSKDKLTIKNIPLSVSNDEIENMLKDNGVRLSSSLRYSNIRNDLGQLTSYKNGDRYVYVEPFDPPLPKNQKVGTFSCLVLHHGKETPCKSCGVSGHRVGDSLCSAKPSEEIVAFKGYTHPLSNHFSCKISAYDTQFDSVEHAYFWRMAMEISKPELAKQIKRAKHAGEAKRLSKNIASDEERMRWELDNTDTMEYLLQQKFQQCTRFKNCLNENKGKIFAEATASRIWGTGLSPFITTNTAPSFWPGKNMLGAMLQELANKMPDQPDQSGTDHKNAQEVILDDEAMQQDEHDEDETLTQVRLLDVDALPSAKALNIQASQVTAPESVTPLSHHGPTDKVNDSRSRPRRVASPRTQKGRNVTPARRAKSAGASKDATPVQTDIRNCLVVEGKRKGFASSPGEQDNESCQVVKKHTVEKEGT